MSLAQLKYYVNKTFDAVFYFYNLLVRVLYETEDKQRRASNRKKHNFNPDSFKGKLTKFKWKVNYFLSKKKFSLKEQKDLISTIRGTVRYGNDVKMPFNELRRRKDLRPFVRMRCDEVHDIVGFQPTYVAMKDKGMIEDEYLAMIQVAYRSTKFLETYDRILESLDEKIKRRTAFIVIMIQPIITLLVAIGGEIFVSLYLVPEMLGVVEDPSQLEGTLASYYRLREILLYEKLKYGTMVLISLTAIYYFFKIKATQYLMDLVIMQLPVMNKFVAQWEISKFFSAINDLIKSGSTLHEALTVGINLVNNKAIKASLMKDIKEKATKTSDLSVIFEDAVFIDERVKNQLKSASNMKTDQKEVLDIIVEEYKDAMKLLMEAPMQMVIPLMLVFGLTYMFTRLVPLFGDVSTMMQNIGT